MTATEPEPEPDPGRDYIVVVGAGKTGTTGLYATIKQSLARAGHHYAAVFEPTRIGRLDAPFTYLTDEPLLVKITMNHVPEVLPDPLVFDRRVMTVRDPRDVLISMLLFRPLTKLALSRTDDAAIEKFIAAVERKEREPGSVSVSELFDVAHSLGIGGRPYRALAASLAAQQDLVQRFSFHVVRYENFVAGNLRDLDGYLGVEHTVASTDPSHATYGHISRSKEAGQFRHWFLPSDLEQFNKRYADALTAFGYESDVDLPDTPTLDPATGSQYLRDRYRQRRQTLATAEDARKIEHHSPQAIAELTEQADDGAAWACLRVAQAHQRGDGVPLDRDAALHWARRSARLGRPEGMRLAAELLDGVAGTAAHRERRMWQAASSRTGGGAASATKHVRTLERELAALRAADQQPARPIPPIVRRLRRIAGSAVRALVRRMRRRVGST